MCRLWLFQITVWEKKAVFCGKAKNFSFAAHLCADSKPLEHDEELGSFWIIKYLPLCEEFDFISSKWD